MPKPKSSKAEKQQAQYERMKETDPGFAAAYAEDRGLDV